MSPTHWVLEADDSILCSDPAHQAIRGLSGVVVVVFVILILLDLLGTTNIFPAIKPINS